MPLLFLAQEAPPAAPQVAQAAGPWWKVLTEGSMEIFQIDTGQPPIVAIPVFVGLLVVVSLVVERIAAFLVRRLTARTETHVDDVFVAALPGLIRTVLVFVGLWVVARALVSKPETFDQAGKAITAGGVLFVGIGLVRVALRMTDAWAEEKEHRRPIGPGIKLAIKVGSIPVLIVTTLHALGVAIAPLIGVLGVGSLAVALALQDVLKNIFCGLQLVVDQPIRAGDFVILDDGAVRGTVLEVGLRSTKLRTVQNNVIIIPNATVAGASITNTDVLDKTYTHVVNVGVAYGSDSRRVERVLLEEATRASDEVPGFAKQPPAVEFTEMGESALMFRIVVKLTHYIGHLSPVSELQHRVYARLRQEGIEIPFPTRTVHIRQEPAKA